MILLGLLAVISASASAALPPGAVEAMKQQARAVFRIELTGVTARVEPAGRYPVRYTAVVGAVIRAKEGVAVGDSICIDSYAFGPDTRMVGPLAPPRLPAGWVGRVFLNPADPPTDRDGVRHYLPAAYGYSFEGARQP